MGKGSLKELVKNHRNAELGNGPRKPKESKWAKDAQEEKNGTQVPTSNVTKIKANDQAESLREEQAASPKKPSRLGSNNITVGMAKWNGKKW